jgi:transposase-like protein
MDRGAPDSPLLVDEVVESWRREKRQLQVRLASEAVDDLVVAYRSGTPCAELGEQFGINESTVFAHLKRRGVERRPFRKLRGEKLERARECYEAGMSLRDVAVEVGVSRSTVHAGLVAAGVEIRRPGRRA